jgi:predicted TPR repeat methyltransferase
MKYESAYTTHDNPASLSREELEHRFDRLADFYDEAVVEWGWTCHEKAVLFVSRHSPDRHSSILDAGCGTGLTGPLLHNAGYANIFGCDVSRGMLGKAGNLGCYKSLETVDLRTPPFPYHSGMFDAVWCSGVLTYFANVIPTMQEFCRITKPGGHIMISMRDDLFDRYDYTSQLSILTESTPLKLLYDTGWLPYMPLHKDYADRIQAAYYVFVKTPELQS